MKDKNQEELFTFDKFISDIEKREEHARKKVQEHQKGQENHPGRKYNQLYRERWQNRLKFGRK